MTKRVVIVGGGWSGCSAAITARNAGADEVVVLERSDELLGAGIVGGIMRNNGRYTAAEEMIALGAGDLFEVCDDHSLHHNLDFPGHKHSWLYNVNTIANGVRDALLAHDIEIWFTSRVNGLHQSDGSIDSVELDSGAIIEGDCFIDATGSVGGQSWCTDNGNGCVMCVVRCPTFGPRVSLSGLAGLTEREGRRPDGSLGAVSGSVKLNKETMDPKLVAELDANGVIIVPMPQSLINHQKLTTKACQQYALPAYAENLVVLDTGQAKAVTPYMPLHEIRQIPGFETVRYEDPYAGSVGNSIRYAAMVRREDTMKVIDGPDNLFCCGEKSGLLVGHTEAIVTGALAGHNAVRALAGLELIEIPVDLATGYGVKYTTEGMETEEGMGKKYTYSGSFLFDAMIEEGLYTTDHGVIADRVQATGMNGVFAHKVT